MLHDKIKLSNGTLFTHFQASGISGRASVIPVQDGGIVLYRDEAVIKAELPTTGIATILEKFSDEAKAEKALTFINTKLDKYLARRRYIATAKGITKWGIIPLFAFLSLLAINSTLTESRIPVAVSQPTSAVQSAMPPAAPAVNSAEMIHALQKGAQSGTYTVSYGTGENTLYVFSDPMCPHCQNLEPILKQLSDAFTIQIFPVSIIGDDASARLIESVLCTAPEERQGMWKNALLGAIQTPLECGTATQAIETNNLVFRRAKMPGTPTIIRSDGQFLPDSVPLNAAAIGQWAAKATGQ